jgi:hypothetical protein
MTMLDTNRWPPVVSVRRREFSNKVHALSKESTLVQKQYPIPRLLGISEGRVLMSRVIILGATGTLGRHVLRQALAGGHDVTVFVRTSSKLPPDVRERVSVDTGDLSTLLPVTSPTKSRSSASSRVWA